MSMNQSEKRMYLLRALLEEGGYAEDIPANAEHQRQLLRGLMNVRRARRAGAEFLRVQDEYLQGETTAKGITDVNDLVPVQPLRFHCQRCEFRHDRLLYSQSPMHR